MQKFVFFLTWCVLILCNYKVLSLTLKPKIKKAQQKLQLYLYIYVSGSHLALLLSLLSMHPDWFVLICKETYTQSVLTNSDKQLETPLKSHSDSEVLFSVSFRLHPSLK